MALHTAGRGTPRKAASAAIAATGAALLALAAILAGCVQQRPRAEAPAAVPPRLEPAYGLFLNEDGEAFSLAYGRAQSDDVLLMLRCRRGARRVEITDVAHEALAKGPQPLTLASGPARSELKAEVAPDENGATLALAQAPADLPALAGFRAGGELSVRLAGRGYAVRASGPERGAVARFFAACEGR